MARFTDNMLATADWLAQASSPLGSAALRRSVSTSYYTLFSRLAVLCAERIARAAPTSDSFRSVYRAIDHGHARSVLLGHKEFSLPLGENFRRLQEARYWADYSIESHPESAKANAGRRFTRLEARQFVSLAADSLRFIDALPPDAKQRLAVTLVTRSRR